MLPQRPRRLRQNDAILHLSAENQVQASDFIYPVFIKEGSKLKEEISAMPGIFRWSIDTVLNEIESAANLGIKAIAIFPVIDSTFKSLDAAEAFNPYGLTQRAIKEIKKQFPEILVVSDIALDPYTTHGHDGLLEDGKIINDATVEVLVKMALAQAEAGSDILAPSDMMDGRIAAIRESLERNKFTDTLIMSYTAKYSSCLYGPFRDALDSLKESNLQDKGIPQNKNSYQMNPANSKEALKELDLDIAEGADIVMVKPASWYLDVIKDFKENSELPVAAYQVSGEYSMICAAAKAGYIDLNRAMNESLTSIKRAGANIILSYLAPSFLKANLSKL